MRAIPSAVGLSLLVACAGYDPPAGQMLSADEMRTLWANESVEVVTAQGSRDTVTCSGGVMEVRPAAGEVRRGACEITADGSFCFTLGGDSSCQTGYRDGSTVRFYDEQSRLRSTVADLSPAE